MLEADRLVIYASSEKEMGEIIERETDAALKAAYGEMLASTLAHAEDWGWYAIWMIVRKDGAHIGNLAFRGSPENGEVELGYGIEEAYRGLGYATEAVETILSWAFDQPGVSKVTAQTAPDNAASRRVLEKCGFLPAGDGKEGPRYERTRDDTDDPEYGEDLGF